jgi:thymidylate kinase
MVARLATLFSRSRKTRSAQRGLWVVLLGPDGAGKSSVIDGIGDGVAAGFTGCEAFHLRPSLFTKTPTARPNCNPHAHSARGALVTFGKLAYLLAANWLGYLAKVKPRLARGALVVFDRYFSDGLVDPKRYRLPQSCAWLVALTERALPKPDLYVVLEASAQVLGLRKQEVASAEVERQCRDYHKLAVSLPNAVVVDAARPLAAVVNEVIEHSIECHLARHWQPLETVR